jgi:hypothetical protein
LEFISTSESQEINPSAYRKLFARVERLRVAGKNVTLWASTKLPALRTLEWDSLPNMRSRHAFTLHVLFTAFPNLESLSLGIDASTFRYQERFQTLIANFAKLRTLRLLLPNDAADKLAASGLVKTVVQQVPSVCIDVFWKQDVPANGLAECLHDLWATTLVGDCYRSVEFVDSNTGKFTAAFSLATPSPSNDAVCERVLRLDTRCATEEVSDAIDHVSAQMQQPTCLSL